MIDFTKEELDFLKDAVREHYKNLRPPKGSTWASPHAYMIKKILSLIDNYCEHECEAQYKLYRLITPIEELFDGNERKVFLCKKCKGCYL